MKFTEAQGRIGLGVRQQHQQPPPVKDATNFFPPTGPTSSHLSPAPPTTVFTESETAQQGVGDRPPASRLVSVSSAVSFDH